MKQTTQTYLSLPETFHPASTASGKHPDSSMPRCYSDGRPYYSLNAWLKHSILHPPPPANTRIPPCPAATPTVVPTIR